MWNFNWIVIDKSTELKEIKGEIDEIKWISTKELISELKTSPKKYCPWMIIALKLLDKSEKSMIKKYASILSDWINDEIQKQLQEAIKSHLSNDKWRLVNETK